MQDRSDSAGPNAGFEPCPNWCDVIPGKDGCLETHYGKDRDLRLDLMPPEQSNHVHCGVPAWMPVELQISLEQIIGTSWPIVTIGFVAGDSRDTLKLSPMELTDLIDILSEVRDDILSASRDREVVSS